MKLDAIRASARMSVGAAVSALALGVTSAFAENATNELVEAESSINACCGVGAGNAYRNRTDFGADKIAMRDMHVGIEIELELCPHVKLIPGVDLYDQFTSAGRHEYHKGFVAVGGVKVAVEF